MWSIIGIIVAIALFSKLALVFYDRTQARIRQKAFDLAAENAAVALATFARASRSYSQANNSGNGTTITVATLTPGGYLPSGYMDTNAFGQTLQARVGANPNIVIAYWSGVADMSRYGIDSTVGSPSYRAAQMKIANAALVPLAQVTGAMAGVASGATAAAAAPYTRLLIPGASNGITVNVSGFSLSQQNAAVYFGQ